MFARFQSLFEKNWFWNNRNKRKKNFEFQVTGIVENYNFENPLLHANAREILAFLV